MRLETSALEVGLEINESKTKFMVWYETERDFVDGTRLKIITVIGKTYGFEYVERFTCLGTEIL